MNSERKPFRDGRVIARVVHFVLPGSIVLRCMLFFLPPPSLPAQVLPAEIKNPQLKALQQTYLPQLIAVNQAIADIKFPFKFSLNRYVGLDPKDQVGADTRGLEFVIFHDRTVLKVTGNYNAAFNADSLTPNRRAARVLNEVIVPILQLLARHFNEEAAFDAFGFELGYHVSRHASSYDYEGKETLVVVFNKADGLRYASLRDDTQRQAVLNSSEIYLSGTPLGLALNSDSPFDVDALIRRPSSKPAAAKDASQATASARIAEAKPQPTAQNIATEPAASPVAGVPVAATDPNALQKKYESELESLRTEGISKFHFVEYAPPSFITFREQVALQATLRNPEAFDKEASSIYRRAARTFDLFLAPQLGGILKKIPDDPALTTLDFSVILDLRSSNGSKSSEAVEFVLPSKSARRFVAADITNQDLINESIVLVNGVRISLNLAQVE
jgi:hypothetical protein